jgi:hypothetical protein
MKWYKHTDKFYAYVQADSSISEMRKQGVQIPVNSPVDIEFNKNKIIIKLAGTVLGEIQQSFNEELNRLQPFFYGAQIVRDDGNAKITLRWILKAGAPIVEIEKKDHVLSKRILKYQDTRLIENKRMKRLLYFTWSNVVMYFVAFAFSFYGFLMYYLQKNFNYGFISLFISVMSLYFIFGEFRKEKFPK